MEGYNHIEPEKLGGIAKYMTYDEGTWVEVYVCNECKSITYWMDDARTHCSHCGNKNREKRIGKWEVTEKKVPNPDYDNLSLFQKLVTNSLITLIRKRWVLREE